MSICNSCNKRNDCIEMCFKLRKEISVRGFSPRRKDRTYTVDFNLLESNQTLNTFQLEVKRNTVCDTFFKEITSNDLKDIIQKSLSAREKEAVLFLLEGYCQQEIASMMNISQKRVSLLINKAVLKLKLFF